MCTPKLEQELSLTFTPARLVYHSKRGMNKNNNISPHKNCEMSLSRSSWHARIHAIWISLDHESAELNLKPGIFFLSKQDVHPKPLVSHPERDMNENNKISHHKNCEMLLSTWSWHARIHALRISLDPESPLYVYSVQTPSDYQVKDEIRPNELMITGSEVRLIFNGLLTRSWEYRTGSLSIFWHIYELQWSKRVFLEDHTLFGSFVQEGDTPRISNGVEVAYLWCLSLNVSINRLHHSYTSEGTIVQKL